MAGEVVVDALPYFDHGYDETGVREAAIALVEEETRRYRPTKNYLDYLPAPNYSSFETEMMKSEFERLQVVYNFSNHNHKIRQNCNIQTVSIINDHG